jgi:hypothetical protein
MPGLAISVSYVLSVLSAITFIIIESITRNLHQFLSKSILWFPLQNLAQVQFLSGYY